MNSREQLDEDVLDEMTNDKAVSCSINNLMEASKMDKTTLTLCKKMEIQQGLLTPVSSDEWLSATLSTLMDEGSYGYTAKAISRAFGCTPETLKLLIHAPNQVPIQIKYDIIGAVARFSLLLN